MVALAPMTVGAAQKGAVCRALEWVEQLTPRGKVLLAVCLVLPLALLATCEAPAVPTLCPNTSLTATRSTRYTGAQGHAQPAG